ncbi:hypothetical protein HZB69_04265 [Candidatus Amesbacteria bacterium]|nr:hypothetical protein [Candidatus Amesbacteria bacterium]
MILNKTILILEDDLLTLSMILDRLSKIEQDQPYDFSVITLTNYVQVEQFINKNPAIHVDMILLDRDCKLGGSFHVADIERLGTDKVIAISSVPEYNKQAQARGVSRVVLKDYRNLDAFADRLAEEVEDLIKHLPMRKDNIVHPI